jgi:hypothetical protein
VPLLAVIWMCSLEDRLLFFEDGVTLTLTDGRRSAWLPFPPSKYSINNDVCDLLLESRPLSRSLSLFLRLVAILTGLPSEGRVYEERSVAFESSVPPPVLLSDSVGAGRLNFLDSTPILTT